MSKRLYISDVPKLPVERKRLYASDVPKLSEDSGYSTGKNPNSLKNLEGRGRTTVYDEYKRRHEINITDTGWAGIQELAKAMGVSASEFVEQIGRGTIEVTVPTYRVHRAPK